LVAGKAKVSIDLASRMTEGTFEVLTQNPDIFLQNKSGWEPLKGSLDKGILNITCKDASSKDTVSWMVVAERADPYIKTVHNVDASGRLIPEWDKKPVDPSFLADRKESQKDYKGPGTEEVQEAKGTKGHVRYPNAYPDAPKLPKRKVIKDDK
jgi:hypothetical protein